MISQSPIPFYSLQLSNLLSRSGIYACNRPWRSSLPQIGCSSLKSCNPFGIHYWPYNCVFYSLNSNGWIKTSFLSELSTGHLIEYSLFLMERDSKQPFPTSISYAIYCFIYLSEIHLFYLSSFTSFPGWRVIDHLFLVLKFFYILDHLWCLLWIFIYATISFCLKSSVDVLWIYMIQKQAVFLLPISWSCIWFLKDDAF